MDKLLVAAYVFYGAVFLLIPVLTFAYVGLLGGAIWMARAHALGQRPWPFVPSSVRRWTRLGIEVSFGLINPVLYLFVLAPSFPAMRGSMERWPIAWLATVAWILLAAFWGFRIFGGPLYARSSRVRTAMMALLAAACVCVLVFGFKDLWLLPTTFPAEQVTLTGFLSVAIRLCPLYLIPVVIGWDYLRAARDETDLRRSGLFLLPDRAARIAAATMMAVALVTVAAAAHRSSTDVVRAMVRDHRAAITQAAARYDVDPRLIAAIVYVTHRDQLSPFRDSLERLALPLWTKGVWLEIGANETLLNRPLDLSVGLAQIKPRTAQTALLLAIGREPEEDASPIAVAYRDREPVGRAWATLPVSSSPITPIAAPATREDLARALLDPRLNLETCALILSLYQRQWDAANPAWSLRRKPEILATLYQIGFARSKPHPAPRSNAFGARVREVYGEPWLQQLFSNGPAPEKPARDEMARLGIDYRGSGTVASTRP